ncbi:hypothetical protein [Pseudarthrobacter sulfonivorans]|uniref:hypothetical protein n=1 Tax=Pseudarthrobacter sulfonivorans TaxID=121292 RepID=UPI00285A2773|nr:hypothetical protein [Pseudarthrobacter sulfonivorans]MDR6415495.1 hypothetical protein [Pseudarthrobacter sulfonivorans]
MPSPDGGTPREADTLVIGAGQAGLAMSYWLTHNGVEHLPTRQGLPRPSSWKPRSPG